MAAKPGAETPTIDRQAGVRSTMRATISSASAGVELRRLAHDAEDGEAVDAGGLVEVDHAVERGGVEGAVGVEGGGGDGVDALGVGADGHPLSPLVVDTLHVHDLYH